MPTTEGITVTMATATMAEVAEATPIMAVEMTAAAGMATAVPLMADTVE